ncbi:tyrosine-protein phosphatase, partial [Pseudonocardia sp. ICBG601]|uniref:tyrosine-protein phosphatase n=1 Tax=Pseudonocardia sp. ICBG601 TaxID=2846759 RepID=UPI001CF6FF48
GARPDARPLPRLPGGPGGVRRRRGPPIAALDSGTTVVHCAAGKDRTGVLVALVCAAVGVPREEITADYALSATRIDALFEKWTTASGEPMPPADELDRHRPRAEVMAEFLRLLDERHGGPVGWLRENGLTDDELARLRAGCARRVPEHPQGSSSIGTIGSSLRSDPGSPVTAGQPRRRAAVTTWPVTMSSSPWEASSSPASWALSGESSWITVFGRPSRTCNAAWCSASTIDQARPRAALGTASTMFSSTAAQTRARM